MLKDRCTTKIAAVALVTTVAIALCGGAAAATTGHDSSPRQTFAHHSAHRHHTVSQAGAFGTVASVNAVSTAGTCGTAGIAGDFVLTSQKGAMYTVYVSATTAFVDPAVTTPSFANVCVGNLVGALGAVTGKTVTATKVYIAPPRTVSPPQHGPFGTAGAGTPNATSFASHNPPSTASHNASFDPGQGAYVPANPASPAAQKPVSSAGPDGPKSGSAPWGPVAHNGPDTNGSSGGPQGGSAPHAHAGGPVTDAAGRS
jgi:hypothetical protein